MFLSIKYPIALLLLFFSTHSIANDTTVKKPAETIPHLEKRGMATQLIVKGKPFLVLGGELHNSSSSNAAYMKQSWGRLANLNFNTVLAAVSWELVEPEEGRFDFSLVDSMLQDARNNNLHIVLLWFASWKNGLSHYVPAWVKKDYKRFPRMRIEGGYPVESISPLSEEARNADTKAFAALMKYVKEKDETQQTVVMVQVQNEVGLIGDSRDHNEFADKAFNEDMPKELINHLQKNKETLLPEMRLLWAGNGFKTKGSWKDVFGNSPAAQEAFMAWNYARYINKITEAGKAQYPLPMFVNAWIVQPEDLKPGDYPSGGPQAHVHDIWRAGAPSIDLLSPDIYLPEFDKIAALYTRSNNVLFIPESRGDSNGAANAFYAIGQHKAIGYSPFGIDNLASGPLSKAYHILQQLAPQILEAQTKNAIAGIWLNAQKQRQQFDLGGYTMDVQMRFNVRRPGVLPGNGYGLVINTGPDEFIIAGQDIQLNFFYSGGSAGYVGISSIDEGVYEKGKWVAGRRLNGDDIMHSYSLAEEAKQHKNGTVVRLPGNGPRIFKVKLYRYE